MKFIHLTPLLLLTLCQSIQARKKQTDPSAVPKDAVHPSKIASLTLHHDKKTTSRRSSPIPQLQCAGPWEICELYEITTMRCTNEGPDYNAGDIQWSCRADLPPEFKLGSTEVSCEGYESSDDEYVLKGSCGVEYRLLLGNVEELKYQGFIAGRDGNRGGHMRPPNQHQKQDAWKGKGRSKKSTSFGEGLARWVFMGVFCAILFVILRGLYNAWADRNNRPADPRRVRQARIIRPGAGRGGGGGYNDNDGDDDYDDGGNDPPPPYTRSPKNQKSTTSTASSSRTNTRSSTNNANHWRPGFWTGAVAGGAAAYMAGSRNQNQSPRVNPMTEQQLNPGSSRGGGWFGNTASSNADSDSGYSAGSRGRISTSTAPSYSSSRYESTGFGGTSRR